MDRERFAEVAKVTVILREGTAAAGKSRTGKVLLPLPHSSQALAPVHL